MADRAEFLNKINHILGIAKEKGSRITLEEVKALLEEDQLTEEQLALTCDYLMAQKIVVLGYEKGEAETDGEQKNAGTDTEGQETEDGQARLSMEEQEYLREYLRDIDHMNPTDAASVRMAYYLPKVVEESLKLHIPDIFIGDLIQEGNISLMMALDGADAGQIEGQGIEEKRVLEEIRGGIRTYIESHTEVKRQGNRMVEKVSRLDEFIKEMTEGLGRKVYMDEVAEKMGISEEEIESILKLAGEEVEDHNEKDL